MHRLIMGNPQGMEVDHINGNGLDNRRCNLRVVTTSQNQANQHARRGRSSFKGVFKQRSRWRARIHVQQKGINLGSFLTEEEAARAYDAAALHYFGEHACLNFPRQEGAA